MRRNRRNNARKERIIMIASSAFVLSALTVTGFYMKSNHTEEKDDGYTLDLSALEKDVQDQAQEIAKGGQEEKEQTEVMDSQVGSPEDDLDYLPMEAGSGMVTIPGLTEGVQEKIAAGEGIFSSEADNLSGGTKAAEEFPEGSGPIAEGTPDLAGGDAAGTSGLIADAEGEADLQVSGAAEAELPGENGITETAGDPGQSQVAESLPEGGADTETEGAATLHFTEGEGLLRPVSGEVLIPFSMDSSVYFSTLDQFKYNPAMMIQAEAGTPVAACAEGLVTEVYQDEEIGNAVAMDLGDGYQIIYGQLGDITVAPGTHVQEGESFAIVAAPTKYYAVEGNNLYLKLTANGMPVNPETLFR